MTEGDLETARERGWRELAEIDNAYARGEIDRAGSPAAVLAIIEPAYLAPADERGGSGHSGNDEDGSDLGGQRIRVDTPAALGLRAHRARVRAGRQIVPSALSLARGAIRRPVSCGCRMRPGLVMSGYWIDP